MNRPLYVLFAAICVALSVVAGLSDRPRAGVWTVIAVLAFVAGRRRVARPAVVAVTAAVPAALSALLAVDGRTTTALLVSGAIFTVVFGGITYLAAWLGSRRASHAAS